jgi:hypothetical protein
VYAVTLSHDYYLDELVLYSGGKSQVYIDNRIPEFIEAAKKSVGISQECGGVTSPPVVAPEVDPPAVTETAAPPAASSATQSTLAPVSTEVYPFVSTTPLALPQIEPSPATIPAETPAVTQSSCQKDLVDLLLIIDTSGSVADAFLNERSFAEKLVQVVPPGDFNSRVSVACVRFDKTAQVEFGFETGRDQATVLKKIQDIEFTGGETSLVAGFNSGMAEIAKGRRPNTRLVIVLVSGWYYEFF